MQLELHLKATAPRVGRGKKLVLTASVNAASPKDLRPSNNHDS